jgi:hypothetical protein
MVAWIVALVDRVWEKLKESTMEKLFKRGDQVTITAPHLAGRNAEILYDMIDDRWVVRLSDANHPSGHSNEGALYAFPADQLEAVEPAPEVKPPATEGEVPEIVEL